MAQDLTRGNPFSVILKFSLPVISGIYFSCFIPKLYASLLASGRSSDLQRALDDPEYLKQLLEKTGS